MVSIGKPDAGDLSVREELRIPIPSVAYKSEREFQKLFIAMKIHLLRVSRLDFAN